MKAFKLIGAAAAASLLLLTSCLGVPALVSQVFLKRHIKRY